MSFVESIPREEIIRFCRRWKVRELALFGSALRADFKPESDVDVLASFHGNAHWGLFDHVQMRLDLEDIFKRKVDLVTRRALEQSQNSLLRARILDTAKVIFADNEAVYAEGWSLEHIHWDVPDLLARVESYANKWEIEKKLKTPEEPGDHLNRDFIKKAENKIGKYIPEDTQANRCIKAIHIPTERPSCYPELIMDGQSGVGYLTQSKAKQEK